MNAPGTEEWQGNIKMRLFVRWKSHCWKRTKRETVPGKNPPLYVSHLRPLFLSFTSCDSQAFSLSHMQLGKEAICEGKSYIVETVWAEGSVLCQNEPLSIKALLFTLMHYVFYWRESVFSVPPLPPFLMFWFLWRRLRSSIQEFRSWEALSVWKGSTFETPVNVDWENVSIILPH